VTNQTASPVRALVRTTPSLKIRLSRLGRLARKSDVLTILAGAGIIAVVAVSFWAEAMG
jgi:hypothetical protein